MTDLKTTFAGLQLKNPIIISSSGLTNSAGKNKKLAEAGAGAGATCRIGTARGQSRGSRCTFRSS